MTAVCVTGEAEHEWLECTSFADACETSPKRVFQCRHCGTVSREDATIHRRPKTTDLPVYQGDGRDLVSLWLEEDEPSGYTDASGTWRIVQTADGKRWRRQCA